MKHRDDYGTIFSAINLNSLPDNIRKELLLKELRGNIKNLIKETGKVIDKFNELYPNSALRKVFENEINNLNRYIFQLKSKLDRDAISFKPTYEYINDCAFLINNAREISTNFFNNIEKIRKNVLRITDEIRADSPLSILRFSFENFISNIQKKNNYLIKNIEQFVKKEEISQETKATEILEKYAEAQGGGPFFIYKLFIPKDEKSKLGAVERKLRKETLASGFFSTKTLFPIVNLAMDAAKTSLEGSGSTSAALAELNNSLSSDMKNLKDIKDHVTDNLVYFKRDQRPFIACSANLIGFGAKAPTSEEMNFSDTGGFLPGSDLEKPELTSSWEEMYVVTNTPPKPALENPKSISGFYSNTLHNAQGIQKILNKNAKLDRNFTLECSFSPIEAKALDRKKPLKHMAIEEDILNNLNEILTIAAPPSSKHFKIKTSEKMQNILTIPIQTLDLQPQKSQDVEECNLHLISVDYIGQEIFKGDLKKKINEAKKQNKLVLIRTPDSKWSFEGDTTWFKNAEKNKTPMLIKVKINDKDNLFIFGDKRGNNNWVITEVKSKNQRLKLNDLPFEKQILDRHNNKELFTLPLMEILKIGHYDREKQLITACEENRKNTKAEESIVRIKDPVWNEDKYYYLNHKDYEKFIKEFIVTNPRELGSLFDNKLINRNELLLLKEISNFNEFFRFMHHDTKTNIKLDKILELACSAVTRRKYFHDSEDALLDIFYHFLENERNLKIAYSEKGYEEFLIAFKSHLTIFLEFVKNKHPNKSFDRMINIMAKDIKADLPPEFISPELAAGIDSVKFKEKTDLELNQLWADAMQYSENISPDIFEAIKFYYQEKCLSLGVSTIEKDALETIKDSREKLFLTIALTDKKLMTFLNNYKIDQNIKEEFKSFHIKNLIDNKINSMLQNHAENERKTEKLWKYSLLSSERASKEDPKLLQQTLKKMGAYFLEKCDSLDQTAKNMFDLANNIEKKWDLIIMLTHPLFIEQLNHLLKTKGYLDSNDFQEAKNQILKMSFELTGTYADKIRNLWDAAKSNNRNIHPDLLETLHSYFGKKCAAYLDELYRSNLEDQHIFCLKDSYDSSDQNAAKFELRQEHLLDNMINKYFMRRVNLAEKLTSQDFIDEFNKHYIEHGSLSFSEIENAIARKDLMQEQTSFSQRPS